MRIKRFAGAFTGGCGKEQEDTGAFGKDSAPNSMTGVFVPIKPSVFKLY